MRTPAELSDLFRSRGLKVTPQRQCIFGVLHGSAAHPTAESVHAAVVDQMPTVSLRTVYQTLNDLTAMGELTSLDLGTGSTRFDPTLEVHHHLVCDRCGQVNDLHADFGEVAVPPGAEVDFTVTATEIVFRGLCGACSATRSPAHDDSGPRAVPAHPLAAPTAGTTSPTTPTTKEEAIHA